MRTPRPNWAWPSPGSCARNVSDEEAQEVRTWLDRAGMTFHTGTDEATELTDAQLLSQFKMYIAAVRVADDFGLDAVGPSKYISADGKSMWLQSNVCPCGGGYPAGDFWAYTFSLRKMSLTPSAPTTPDNPPDAARNLAREPGTVPIERATHFGRAIYNDGDTTQNEDDWNDERKPTSWWGYTWPRTYRQANPLRPW
ncbi:hypothetical protein [Streptomyces asiaticus]|uniref:hypothetical protein n=1 Tax=Streptomyces asiaticus TaxID=114695 RepID=UPI00382C1B99